MKSHVLFPLPLNAAQCCYEEGKYLLVSWANLHLPSPGYKRNFSHGLLRGDLSRCIRGPRLYLHPIIWYPANIDLPAVTRGISTERSQAGPCTEYDSYWWDAAFAFPWTAEDQSHSRTWKMLQRQPMQSCVQKNNHSLESYQEFRG